MKEDPGGAPVPDGRHARVRAAVEALLTFGAVFGASLLAINSASLSGGILVVWPADGLIVGLMLAPRTRRPWIVMVAGLIGALLAFCLVGRQMVLGLSRVGLMAAAIPIAFLAIRRILRDRGIAETRGLLPFMAACALIGVVTAFVRSVIVHQFWGFPVAQLTATTTTATFAGFAVITPLILLLSQPRLGPPLSPVDRLKVWSIVALYTGAMIAAFMEPRYPAAYLAPLGLILVAHAVDFTGIVAVILVTAISAVTLTFLGHGPIAHFSGDIREKVLMTQTFMAIIICSTLPFSVLKQDRERLRQSLITALDDAKAASQAKSTFLAVMSHEIRTPLNGVLGMAQAIEMGELTPVQRERVAVVRSSGESLLMLLNDVLDLSKVEAGKLILESIPFDPAGVVATVVAQNQALAEGKGLFLSSDTQGLEGAYLGDPNRLKQIIQNLASNAIKFTRSGGVTITATSDDDGLRFQVRDTGMGIPVGQLGNLFQKFYQVDDSTTRQFGGTGLGLSICRELAQAMGGDVGVESKVGVGSTFTLTVPLRRTAPAVVEPAQDDARAAEGLSLRVLAAEDNATNQLVLKTLLGAAGVTPTIVGNGLEAVAAWRKDDWDLILMDVQMPVMDGLTAVREIRKGESEQGRARSTVIALTANAMNQDVKQYLSAGMDDFLAKPISVDKLFAMLEAVQSAKDADQGVAGARSYAGQPG